MNIAILTGYVGQDPKVITFDNGAEIVTFSLATRKRGFTTQDGRVFPEKTFWHNIIVRGGLTKVAKEFIHKGTQISLTGEINYREYDKNNGEKGIQTEIVVNSLEQGTIELLGGSKSNGNQSSYNEQYNPQAGQPQQQYQQPTPQPQYQQGGQPQYQQPAPQPQYQQPAPQPQYQQGGQPQYQQPAPQPQYQQPVTQNTGSVSKDDNLPF
jgi:single-strand DNA-binding protein